MNILGISAGFHDAGITLINDGEIKFAAHAERYSKVKHDSELNAEILNDCFDRYGTPTRIAYYERPWLKKTRQLYAGQYRDIFEPGIKHRLEQIWSRESMPPIEYHGHHLSHAAAGFHCDCY
jgi:carbamoyltransferase